jgi:hypothetical protein
MELAVEQGADLHKTQAGRVEMRSSEMRREQKLFAAYQFVYVWQSKFQSIPLCAVDAPPPSVQTSS